MAAEAEGGVEEGAAFTTAEADEGEEGEEEGEEGKGDAAVTRRGGGA